MPQLKTPVALIIFKRADTALKVVEAMRAAAPLRVYLIADGGRSAEEQELCRETRHLVEAAIDWPCNVHKDFSDKNLGSKRRIVSGLDKVFEQEERAIILEDDTVPHPSFFRFAEELLERYAENPRILQIAGANFQQGNSSFSAGGSSYYFSRFPEIWGWATWRRAWKLFDASMAAWPQAREEKVLSQRISDPAAADYWEHLFNHVHNAGDDRKKSDVWAAQWVFTALLHDSFSVIPSVNLVTNIGQESSRRANKDTKGSNILGLRAEEILFPLAHPEEISSNEQADAYSLSHSWKIKNTFREKALFYLKQNFPALHRGLKRLFKRP